MNIHELIIPVPQNFQYLDSKTVKLGVPGKAYYVIENEICQLDTLAQSAVKRLSERLGKLLNACPCRSEKTTVIKLMIGEAPVDMKNADQGYSIKAADDKLTVTGYGSAGFCYAVTTLIQMLKVEANILELPAFELCDWPDMRTRGHFMESRYGSNLMTLDDWKIVADNMAGMKMNQLAISVYGCWCVQYDNRVSEYLYVPIKNYPKLKTPVVTRYYSPSEGEWVDYECLPPMFKEDYFGELIAYGKSKGVTIFPLVNSCGHNTLIPAKYPEVSAKDENGAPSLTGYCTSNPKTYELLFDIYDELIDRYLAPNGIDCFHVGLDEVGDGIAQNAEDIFRKRSPWCKCSECAQKSRARLFIDHAVRVLKHLKERGMKHIYMYHDMLIDHGPCTTADGEDKCKLMMEAIRDNDLTNEVIIDWWTYSDFQESLMFQTTHPELGLRRTVKPWNGYYHWNIPTSPLKNIYLLAKMGNEEGCEGMLSYSAQDESFDRNNVTQANYAWNYEGTGDVDEADDAYILANFGNEYVKAKRAFSLYSQATAHSDKKYEDGTPVVSNGGALQSVAAYYYYSYVCEGKPYPRHYPGETVVTMLANKEEYIKVFTEISVIAREAELLFTELAGNANVAFKKAERFAYDSANYVAWAEDMLALLEMVKLNERFMECDREDCLTNICTLAVKRKNARLSLMARLEKIKEKYLLASHMRNQTIPMQYFADLEGYLTNTDLEDIKLDFTDNTHFASEAFMKLR